MLECDRYIIIFNELYLHFFLISISNDLYNLFKQYYTFYIVLQLI